MPLYEYECRGCGKRFEHLVRAGQSASCPSCQSDNLEKLLSVCAVRSSVVNVPQERIVSLGDGPGHCGRFEGSH